MSMPTEPADSLLATPPFAPHTVRALNNLGFYRAADLRAAGAVRAFLLLKAAGHTVTRSVLWQLAAVCSSDGALPDTAGRAALNAALSNHPPVAVFPPPHETEYWMRQALQQAEYAALAGEIPVGAVVVREGRLLAAAHNTCVGSCDISQHAEIRALSAAGAALGNYRLHDCDVYITLEPCPMCASALIQARVRRVVYAAAESKSGAAGSVIDLFADPRLNRHTAVLGGILADESRALLQAFFRQRRQGNAAQAV